METVLERLLALEREGMIPFHMPGHKRNTELGLYLECLGARMDVTEIPGFDDLHDAQELLQNALKRAAELCGSEAAFFCVNGSTGGILAAVRAATRRGDRVLVARNCHKAVYHALELCGLLPVYLQPPLVKGFGCAASIVLEEVEEALSRYPDIRLVIVTSPSYEGVLSDVGAIAALAHGRGIPLFVDEAHGAHLGLSDGFPQSAVGLGTDLVVQSFHKTLPSLTQTAVLHCNGTLISRDEVKRQWAVFQSSSPSYLLLASLDGCVSLLLEQKKPLFEAWTQRLDHFYARMRGLQHLQLLSKESSQEIYAFDPGKLVIGTARSGLSGVELSEILRDRYHIQLEMALCHYALAMTGLGDTQEMMQALGTALLEIDAACTGQSTCPETLPLPLPTVCHAMEEALSLPWESCAVKDAIGRVSAAGVWAYPPGVPLLLPGELCSEEVLAQLVRLTQVGVHLVCTRTAGLGTLAVLRT